MKTEWRNSSGATIVGAYPVAGPPNHHSARAQRRGIGAVLGALAALVVAETTMSGPRYYQAGRDLAAALRPETR